MDNTLGIDCPKNYLFNESALMTDTPRRLSTDFEEGEIEFNLTHEKKLR